MASPELMALCARIARHGLIGAECAALTGGRPDESGIARCTRIDRIDRAAYTHRGVRVVASESNLESLVGTVSLLGDALDADRFRIDVHDPEGRLAGGAAEIAIALADVMPFDPDLSDPLRRFEVVACADTVAFGVAVTESDASYRRHDAKPWTTSSSLDSRFARALVNLVPDARSILDPCCGAGSIVVEAASLGIVAHGVDWKPAMVGMTRENLAHFGYAATVERADSRTHVQPADAVVTDLPYGHAIEVDERSIRAILDQAATLAPHAVFVAPADISTWLASAGYVDIDVHTVLKRRGFTRWIHIARTGQG